ncbi:Protein BREAKING OF ASYMMETRY IN THE STOMATAL LINEAGE [Glycine max]|nr:Protein BREAKING OF ASYMMETRY IN THE STOMATAL LINEAGE [Glycine max]
MSTMTWLARSFFSVCWLPLDDHKLTSSPHGTMKNMAFDRKNEKSFDSISNNNLSRPSKKFHSKKRHSNNPIIKDKDGGGVPIGNKFDYSSWSLSADEDYIVFCFGKDVAKGDKGVNEVHKNSRPVNCKQLKYGENEEQVSDLNIHEKISNANQHHDDDIRRAESSNSDQSEGSRSSFAFPVLGWEWIGSPVQMPKSEGLHLRKNKARAMRFQCCRF